MHVWVQEHLELTALRRGVSVVIILFSTLETNTMLNSTIQWHVHCVGISCTYVRANDVVVY